MGSIGDFDLKNIRRNTGIGTFIETGTLYGHGILEAHRAGNLRDRDPWPPPIQSPESAATAPLHSRLRAITV